MHDSGKTSLLINLIKTSLNVKNKLAKILIQPISRGSPLKNPKEMSSETSKWGKSKCQGICRPVVELCHCAQLESSC
jgi:hypothetical protein